MSNITTLTKGKWVVDISTGEGGYNYYAFVHPEKGQVVLMREKTDGTEYLFKNGNFDLTLAWTNRASGTYTTREQI